MWSRFPSIMRYRKLLVLVGSVLIVMKLIHSITSSNTHKRSLYSPHLKHIPDGFGEYVQNNVGGMKKMIENQPAEDLEPKCAFSKQCSKADHQVGPKNSHLKCIYDLWNNMSAPGHDTMIEDNYWYTLSYDQTTVTKQKKLKVIVMPHCHADPGWLRTYKDYSQDTDSALNYMLKFLPNHPKMTFTWMEVSFFQLWWSKLDPEQKQVTKRLLANGQLELTSGSWVMTDEANPYYWASVNNIVDGHQWLQKELGFIPKVQWSNDPFGYGPSVPWLFKKAGLDKLVINRVHKSVKMQLQRRKAIPFKWRQSWDLDGSNDVLTNVLPFTHYDVPNSCGPNADVCCQFDFKRLTHFYCGAGKPVPIIPENVAERAQLLYDQYRLTGTMTSLNVVLSLLGDDFRYIDEQEWHQQHDNYIPLFDYMNSHPDWNIDVSFGTFSDYFKALEDRSKETEGHQFPTVSGDFFPYHDFADHYWTGYYTTRPFYKRVDRLLQGYIRAADILMSLAVENPNWKEMGTKFQNGLLSQLAEARQQLSLFQHHDAITGTSRYAAVEDYGRRMFSAMMAARDVIGFCSKVLMTKYSAAKDSDDKAASKKFNWVVNEILPAYNTNEVKMPIVIDEHNLKTVAVFNALAYEREEVMRLHINTPQVTVTAVATGNILNAQINPVLDYMGFARSDLFELIVLCTLPALSLTSYTLEYAASQPSSTTIAHVFTRTVDPMKRPTLFSRFFNPTLLDPSIPFKMETELLTTIHAPHNGLISGFMEGDGLWRAMELQFWQYRDTRSGAYLFLPTTKPMPWPENATRVIHVFQGPLMTQTHTFMDRIYHSATLYNTEGPLGQQIHIENMVDLRDENNVEIVMQVATDITHTNATFFTDSIGLQFLKRQNHPNQRIDKNYYPMPSAAFVQNTTSRITVIGGHPHGVSSPNPGTLEIMLDRILNQDDYKGLGSNSDSLIRDNLPSISQFRIVPERRNGQKAQEIATQRFAYHSMLGHQSINSLLYPAIVLNPVGNTKTPLLDPYMPMGTQSNLPCDISLLTVRTLEQTVNKDKLLILLRHGIDCSVLSNTKSQCQNGSLANIFQLLQRLNVEAIEETNLSGVTKVQDVDITDWKSITLGSMDIKSYLLKNT